MRGLTPDERRELEDGRSAPGDLDDTVVADDCFQQVLNALLERGLVSALPLPDGTFFAHTTSLGELALRLDALARGIG